MSTEMPLTTAPPEGPVPGTPQVTAWAGIASEAAAAHEEVAHVLAAGLEAPGVLEGLGRAASTLRWVQQRVEAGVAGPQDPTAIDAVMAARSSIADAQDLVRGALATCTAGGAGMRPGPLH